MVHKTNGVVCDRLMALVEKGLDDKFYLEDSQRLEVRNKIARELCV